MFILKNKKAFTPKLYKRFGVNGVSLHAIGCDLLH